MDLTKNMKKPIRPALGRGLGSLVSTPVVSVVPPPNATPAQSYGIDGQAAVAAEPSVSAVVKAEIDGRAVHFVPIEKIVNNPSQPRQRFVESEVAELAGSIKTLGVLQPVLLRPCRGERAGLYEIVAGERRWRASKLAGLAQVPALIQEMDDIQALEIALVENVQRSNLNPVEEAQGYQRLIDEFRLSQKDVAERVGKDRASVANYLRLLVLPESVLKLLQEGAISMGHAKAILTVREPSAQVSLARKAVDESLSVRALEAIVSRTVVLEAPKRPVSRVGRERGADGVPVDVIDRMRNRLGTKVVVRHHRSGRGKIEIEYFSEQELDRLVELICG
jgi:ParB family chromosome partitioning protein